MTAAPLVPVAPERAIRRGLPATLRTSRRIRRRLLALVARHRKSTAQYLTAAAAELKASEPALAHALGTAQLAAWTSAAQSTTLALPPLRSPWDIHPAASGAGKPPSDPPKFAPSAPPPGGDGRGNVRLPQIVKAAEHLRTRLDFTPTEFKILDADAQRVGFTIARATSTQAVSRVREALARDIETGGNLGEFREAVVDALGPVFSDSQIEAVYRTHVGRAYSAGQQAVLNHPLVRSEFPYLLYSATHDSRTRPEHLAMEELGLDGTAVYRADDPVWNTHYPPWAWNCRCLVIPLSIADAAERGVREARTWLRTARPPMYPQFVKPIPYPPPKGWVPTGRRLIAV